MWLSAGGVCVVVLLALAVTFAGRRNRTVRSKVIRQPEVVAQSSEKVLDGSNANKSTNDLEVTINSPSDSIISKLKKEAESGDELSAISQNELGVRYSEGKDVEKNDKEAVKWFRKSAEQGFAPA